MSSVKRAGLVVGIVLSAIAVTGCLDVVQYVSGDGQNIDVFLRLTLQKSAFEMANSFSDAPQDLDEMFESEFGFDEPSVTEELPPGVQASFGPVNTEFEYGFTLEYTAPREALGEGSKPGAFVPQITMRGMTIPLAESDGASGDNDEFAAAFLGGAKYRLLISKRLISRVSMARLMSGGEAMDVGVTDFPDVWMIEFPVSAWLMSNGEARLEILF